VFGGAPADGHSADSGPARTLGAVDAVAADERRAAEFARLREVLLVALVIMLPIAIGDVIWASAGGDNDFNLRVSFSPFDIPLAALLVVMIIDRGRAPRLRATTWTARCAVALGAVLVAAFVVHPSPRGLDLAFRLAAGLAVIHAFTRLRPEGRRHVVAALAGVGALEAVIACLESLKGGVVGLGALEFGGFFYRFGSSTAAHAGFDHPYHLACFLLVTLAATALGATRGDRLPIWLAGAAVIGSGLATTYSRAVLVTLLVIVGILVLARGETAVRQRRRKVAAAIAVGFLLAAISFGDGWISRGSTTSSGQNLSSSRGDYIRDALRLTRDHPFLGVGPGRYTIALQSVPHKDLLPVHNFPLLEAAEGGVLAGVLAAALLVAIAWRALRRGVMTMVVFSSLALFYVLDAYPVVFATGLAVSAVWLGLQEIADDEW